MQGTEQHQISVHSAQLQAQLKKPDSVDEEHTEAELQGS